MLAGPLAFEYFFLCRNALSPVLLFSLSGKLYSLEEPSSYMVSSIKAFSSPVERDRHPLSVLPWFLCSVAFEAKIYFLLFFPVPDNGVVFVQWIFDGVSFGNLPFPESAHLVWERPICPQLWGWLECFFKKQGIPYRAPCLILEEQVVQFRSTRHRNARSI